MALSLSTHQQKMQCGGASWQRRDVVAIFLIQIYTQISSNSNKIKILIILTSFLHYLIIFYHNVSCNYPLYQILLLKQKYDIFSTFVHLFNYHIKSTQRHMKLPNTYNDIINLHVNHLLSGLRC